MLLFTALCEDVCVCVTTTTHSHSLMDDLSPNTGHYQCVYCVYVYSNPLCFFFCEKIERSSKIAIGQFAQFVQAGLVVLGAVFVSGQWF